jgi:hypothetical protein
VKEADGKTLGTDGFLATADLDCRPLLSLTRGNGFDGFDLDACLSLLDVYAVESSHNFNTCPPYLVSRTC